MKGASGLDDVAKGTFDAVVVGAGIVGAACAWRLSADGLRVAVIDPLAPGSVATTAGMGHVVVVGDAPARLALSAYGRALWARLGPALPGEAAYRTPGTLWIADTAADIDAMEREARALAAAGVACERLSPVEVARREPRLRAVAGGLLVAEDAVVYAPAVAAWLVKRACAAGSVFVRGTRVRAIAGDGGPGGDASVTLADGREVRTAVVVNAAGVDAPSLTPGLAIRPRKGHLILTAPASPAWCAHEVIEMAYLTSAHGSAGESVAFNIQPRAEGRVLIGASRQYGAKDALVEERMLAKLLERAAFFMPGLERAPIERTWTGFRPATPDGLPLIGAMGERGEHANNRPRVFVAAGHEGLGITTALATGQIIADMVAGRTPSVDVRPLKPDRAMPTMSLRS